MDYLLHNQKEITIQVNNLIDTSKVCIGKLLNYDIMLEHNSITPLEDVIPTKPLLTSNTYFDSIEKIKQVDDIIDTTSNEAMIKVEEVFNEVCNVAKVEEAVLYKINS